jgi:excisionase family DNA binding protein
MSNSDIVPRFLTVQDTAVYTSLSPASVRRMLATGKLTALRPVKGRVVIDRQQLDSVVLSSDFRPRKGRGLR